MFVMYLSNFDSLQSHPGGLLRAASASPTSSRRRSARRSAWTSDLARDPGRRGRRDARRRRRHARRPRRRRARPGRLISIPDDRRPRAERPLPPPWPLDRARPRRRGAGRARRSCTRTGSSPAIASRRSSTAAGATLTDRRRRALARVRLRDAAGRAGARRRALRHLLDGPAGALATAFDMEGGFNDVVLRSRRARPADEVIARLDRLLEPYGGLGADPARAADLALDASRTSSRSSQSFGFLLPLDLPGRGRLPPQRRADAGARRCSARRSRRSRRSATRTQPSAGTTSSGRSLIAAAGRGDRDRRRRLAGARMIIELYNQFFRFPVLLYQRLRSASCSSRRWRSPRRRRRSARFFGRAPRRARCRPPRRCGRSRRRAYRRSMLETPLLVPPPRRTPARMVLRNLDPPPAARLGVDRRHRVRGRDPHGRHSCSSTRSNVLDRDAVLRSPSGRTSPWPSSSRARAARASRSPGCPACSPSEPQRSVAVRIRVGPPRAYAVDHRACPPNPRLNGSSIATGGRS